MSRRMRSTPFGDLVIFDEDGMPVDDEGGYHLTIEDFRLSRRATGRGSGYRWVDPHRDNRTKEEWQYSYSEFYLWGEAPKGEDAVYSDRLAQYSRENWDRAWAAVGTDGGFRYMSSSKADKFMSAYYQKDIVVTAMAEGCNGSSGYPYWILWYHEKKGD